MSYGVANAQTSGLTNYSKKKSRTKNTVVNDASLVQEKYKKDILADYETKKRNELIGKMKNDSSSITLKDFRKIYRHELALKRSSEKDALTLKMQEYLSDINDRNDTSKIDDAIRLLSDAQDASGTDAAAPSSCCDVKIFGTGAANATSSDLSSNTGNLSLGFAVSFGNRKNNDDTMYKHYNTVYGMFNAHAANTADSNVLAKTFLFPQIGKRVFTLGYQRTIHTPAMNCFSIVPYAEFSWNKVTSTKDSTQSINTISATFGCHFEWHGPDVKFGDTSVPFVLSLSPYYNLISVDSKYFTGNNNIYSAMFGETNLPPTFHTAGFETVVQLGAFQIFSDIKWVLNDKNVTSNMDLKGAGIVIGTIVNADFLNL